MTGYWRGAAGYISHLVKKKTSETSNKSIFYENVGGLALRYVIQADKQ